MADVYRKFGQTVRYENGVFVHVEEGGEAIEDGDAFSCRPIARRTDLPRVIPKDVETAVAEVRALVQSPLTIERLVVSLGVAEHQYGDRTWREDIRRIHLSIAYRSVRALLDLGDFELEDVRRVAEALPRCAEERAAPQRIVLEPNVTAALLPSIASVAPPNIRMMQSARGVDGRGEPVKELALAGVAPYPNVYRPSYRVRPVRLPFHLRAECDVTTIDSSLPRAIALLAPPEALVLRVLCADGALVYPATIRVTRIDSVARETHWYPYGAGSFGSEMML